jgi:dephospho-CoA kinase
LERGRIDRLIAGQIIDSQTPLQEKINRADHVVWNNGDHVVLAEQASALVRLWRG